MCLQTAGTAHVTLGVFLEDFAGDPLSWDDEEEEELCNSEPAAWDRYMLQTSLPELACNWSGTPLRLDLLGSSPFARDLLSMPAASDFMKAAADIVTEMGLDTLQYRMLPADFKVWSVDMHSTHTAVAYAFDGTLWHALLSDIRLWDHIALRATAGTGCASQAAGPRNPPRPWGIGQCHPKGSRYRNGRHLR